MRRGFLLGIVALGLIIGAHVSAAAQAPPAPPVCEDERARLDIHLRKVLTDRVLDEVEASTALVAAQRQIQRLQAEVETLKAAPKK